MTSMLIVIRTIKVGQWELKSFGIRFAKNNTKMLREMGC